MNSGRKLAMFGYFFILFFNTFVDLGHKILIQNIFYTTESPHDFTVYSSVLSALILIPYLMMFTPAGFIADKFAKAKVLRFTAWAAVPLTILITVFYYQGHFWAAFSMTLLLGMQSAINSPAKYGYVKEFFGKEKSPKPMAMHKRLLWLRF
ncbi:MFS transporter [Piscirickettsia litoralis]|uniref:MFS transporter n=1 Tax=Piscirickettsia litoralis TaxID=1891921 RepID=UPI000981CFD5|nr:MFS transporter [Piscirickettsia litoralis]